MNKQESKPKENSLQQKQKERKKEEEQKVQRIAYLNKIAKKGGLC